MKASAILPSAPNPPPQGFYVYAHRRATDGEVFYVGKGKGLRAWRPQKRSAHWYAVALKYGVVVEIAAAQMTEADAFMAECAMIADCRMRGIQLTNKTDGGEGPSGFSPTPEMRAARSAAMIGRKTGPHSEEHRRNISRANAGKPVPDDRKARIAVATAAAMKDPAIVEKMRLAKLGKTREPHSDATKAKMRAAALGKPKSAAARANMSIAQRIRFGRQQPQP